MNKRGKLTKVDVGYSLAKALVGSIPIAGAAASDF